MEGLVASVAYAEGRRLGDVAIAGFMPELEWRYGYPAVMAGMATLCVYLYDRFNRSGWL